jgi:hypothetical protein
VEAAEVARVEPAERVARVALDQAAATLIFRLAAPADQEAEAQVVPEPAIQARVALEDQAPADPASLAARVVPAGPAPAVQARVKEALVLAAPAFQAVRDRVARAARAKAAQAPALTPESQS